MMMMITHGGFFILILSYLALVAVEANSTTSAPADVITSSSPVPSIPHHQRANDNQRSDATLIAGASVGAVSILGLGSYFAVRNFRKDDGGSSSTGAEENSFEQVDKEKMMEIDIDEFLR